MSPPPATPASRHRTASEQVGTALLDAAQAVYRALGATGVYRELVVESGWHPDRFERWLADTLAAQLTKGPTVP